MTEPPEPRQPDDAGGEDDPISPDESRELDELLNSEWLDEMGDDLLLDEIGRGDDSRTIYDDGEDDTLIDELHDAREEIADVPLPEKTSPHAVMAEFERRKKAAEPPGPRAPDTGGTAPVTATEDAAHLRALGTENYTNVLGAIDTVNQALEQVSQALAQVGATATEGVGAAAGILGEGHANLNDINGATAALSELVTPMQGEIESLRQQCNTLQAQAATVESTYSAAANAIGGGA